MILKEEMSKSRTKHKILPLSRFGLMQVTRQRVREETEIKTTEPNPNAKGEVEAPILLIDEIQRELEKHLAKGLYKDISIHVHPFVAAYLTKGGFFKSLLWKWRRTYKKKLKIIERDSFKYLQYHFELQKK
jgi:ribonuclease G